MTVIPQLKEDLFEAAQRVLPPEAGHAQAPRLAARGWPSGRVATVVPVLVSVVLVVGIAAVALTAFRHGRPPRAAVASSSAAGSGSRRELIETIGVLRRPQKAADLGPAIRAAIERAFPPTNQGPLPSLGHPDLSLVRYATTTGWGQRLYLVPVKPHRTVGRAAVSHSGAPPPRVTENVPETLALVSPQGWIINAQTAADIKAGTDGVFESAGQRVLGGGTSAARFIYVVPDGVATVAFVLPRDALPGVPFEPVYASTLTVRVPVHDNIAAVQVDRQFDRSGPPMIWYAADGRVIKRIGNFATLDRVVPEPLPGPATPQSRAAEKNPSTPNAVWVTPTSGTTGTKFTFHFQVLLNEAYYTTRLSGPRCPGQHLYGVNPGETQPADNLRGHIFDSLVSLHDGRWCPGTYRLSVTPISGAFDSPLKTPGRSFGTATFTVRP
jgi:hypothetical protein